MLLTGRSISRVIPHMLGANMTRVFNLMRPRMEFCYDNILSHTNTVYVLCVKDTVLQDEKQSILQNKHDRLGLHLLPHQNRTNPPKLKTMAPQNSSLHSGKQTKNGYPCSDDINDRYLLNHAEPNHQANQQVLRLKGEMTALPETDGILFTCSPCITSLGQLQRQGLYLSDIPLHDATRDLLLLSQKFQGEYRLTRQLEILTDQLQQSHCVLEIEKKKTDR